MLAKILVQILLAAFFLSVSVIAQQTISLSEHKNSESAESKESDSEMIKVKTQEDIVFSKFEQEVFEEINEVRQNPLKYVDYLQEYKKMLNGKILSRPNQPRFMTIEGSSAIDEIISDLQNTTALRPLTASKFLTLVANNLLNDLKENPKLGHYGKDGSDFRKRLARSTKVENTPRKI
jgi:uncharacterized protein YkwD